MQSRDGLQKNVNVGEEGTGGWEGGNREIERERNDDAGAKPHIVANGLLVPEPFVAFSGNDEFFKQLNTFSAKVEHDSVEEKLATKDAKGSNIKQEEGGRWPRSRQREVRAMSMARKGSGEEET